MKHITFRAVAQVAFLFMAATMLVVSPLSRADYVASAKEERDWAARIAKSPPTATTLGGAVYPGAKLNRQRSGEKTAENQGRPMVYAYVVRASMADVRAYYNGPGKREAGAPILNESDGSVEIMYYMIARKTAAPAVAPTQPARAPTASAIATAESSSTVAPESPPAALASTAADTAKQAIDAVNSLRGLFGR